MYTKLIGITFAALLQGCANLSSVDRTTSLPDKDGRDGKAIHLDAKQRVVLAKSFGAVCAEPNPDALSAFATALTAGAADATKTSVTVGSSLSETAASIGLRTQSITLMRDMLYRICEAYYNKAIDGPQVMQLLGRSQDRAIAALAIEQLTGVVAARQAALGTASSATAVSNLQNVQHLLESARADEEAKNAKLTQATEARDKKGQEIQAKQAELAKVTDSGETARLQAELDQLKAEKSSAEQLVTLQKSSADDAKKNREMIEKARSSAYTSVTTTANGTATLSDAVASATLDQKNTEAIANSVKAIVEKTLGKNYIVDGCFAMLSRNWPDPVTLENPRGATPDELAAYKENIAFCRQIIATSLSRPSSEREGAR